MSEGTWEEYSHQQCTCEVSHYLSNINMGTQEQGLMIGGKEERPGHEVANDCGGLRGVQDEVTELKGLCD